MSSGGYTSLLIKEVSSPRSEILSPAGSRSSNDPPIIELSSSSAASCASTDVMEGYLSGYILKPDGVAVFDRVFGFVPIWRDLLAMVTVSSYLPYARA